MDEDVKMTFSSVHPGALSLYTSFGLTAWWPLLYLTGAPSTLAVPEGFEVRDVSPAAAAALEMALGGRDRDGDHQAWGRRPGARALQITDRGSPVAVAAAGGARSHHALEHLWCAPHVDPVRSEQALVATLAVLRAGQVTVHLPAPHPATRGLLARGWRLSQHDLFMATTPDLVDPVRQAPSPALA
jgi:hypothetical protein